MAILLLLIWCNPLFKLNCPEKSWVIVFIWCFNMNKSQDTLKKLAIKDHWFDKEKFKNFKQIAADQTPSLPPSGNLRKNVLFTRDEFKENVYLKFISSFQLEIKSTFSQLQFWLNFYSFGSQKAGNNIWCWKLWYS